MKIFTVLNAHENQGTPAGPKPDSPLWPASVPAISLVLADDGSGHFLGWGSDGEGHALYSLAGPLAEVNQVITSFAQAVAARVGSNVGVPGGDPPPGRGGFAFARRSYLTPCDVPEAILALTRLHHQVTAGLQPLVAAGSGQHATPMTKSAGG